MIKIIIIHILDLFILFFGNDGDNLARYMGLNGMQVSDISDILYLSCTTGVQNIRLKGIQFPPKNQKWKFIYNKF